MSIVQDAENKPVRDPVSHYQRGGLECIDAMRAISTPEEFRGYLKLTAFKYLWRLGEKDLPVKEAKKAKDYITWLHEELAMQDAKPEGTWADGVRDFAAKAENIPQEIRGMSGVPAAFKK